LILAGKKTQTRRALKPQPHGIIIPWQPGDTLWVRETWSDQDCCEGECFYRATIDQDTTYSPEEIAEIRWQPSIFMPRWASRITLAVTTVKVERLQDISEEDATAEGCGWNTTEGDLYVGEPVAAYARLWNSINGATGPKSWQANPWVAAISFKLVEG
jgi:hypothetical protein